MLEFNATFFIAMINFVIFILIMNAILYKPLERIIAKRKNLIDSNNQKSKEANDKFEELIQWQKSSMEKAHKSSRESYLKILNEFKSKKESILEYEKNYSKKEIEIASAELESEVVGAKYELKSEVELLADIITKKVLG